LSLLLLLGLLVELLGWIEETLMKGEQRAWA